MANSNKFKVILPPNDMKIVRLWVSDGPSFDAIKDCVGAPRFDQMVDRGLSFAVPVLICRDFEDMNWETHRGSYSEEYVPIIITSLRRVNDQLVSLGGHLRYECLKDEKLLSLKPSIYVERYCLKGGNNRLIRRGRMSISRKKYVDIVGICQERNDYS